MFPLRSPPPGKPDGAVIEVFDDPQDVIVLSAKGGQSHKMKSATPHSRKCFGSFKGRVVVQQVDFGFFSELLGAIAPVRRAAL